MSGKDAEVFFERLALLDKADASFIWRALAGETPQAIALIANHLSPANVAKLLAVMPSEVREEVSFRMLVQGPPRPEALTALAQGSEHFLKIAATGGEIKESQTQFFVDVVSAMGRTLGRDVLVALRERNEELADAIEQKMFTFQDLLKLPGVHLQAVLRNVAIADLALAMKGTSATQREGILSNLSQRARAVLEEEISLLGAVVLQDVERAQREIVQAARTLEASGEIQLEASNVEYIE
jgi:flagellar motor switch protein FliG